MKNLLVRTVSGLIYIIVAVSCLLFNQYGFAAFALFMMVSMMVEFYNISIGPSKYRFSRFLAILSAIIMFCLAFANRAYGLSSHYMILSILPVLTVMLDSVLVKDKSEFGLFGYIYTAILYIACPMIVYNFLAFTGGSFNGKLLISFFCIISISDVGAYVFGVGLGKKFTRKLCPKISPNKSWVGFWGGLLCSVLMAVILQHTGVFEVGLIHAIILSVLIDVTGVFGDLFESQWKRYFDVKDSGKIIPGHGGMLDRFDSSLFALPVGTAYITIMNLF